VFVASGTHDPAQKTPIPVPIYDTALKLATKEGVEERLLADKGSLSDHGQRSYSTSKLCNVLCTYELARQLEKAKGDASRICVNAFDPGLMPGTGLARDYNAVIRFAWNYILPSVAGFLSRNVHTPQDSGRSLARVAIDPTFEGVTSKYFEGVVEIKSSADSYSEEKAADLWKTSISLTKLSPEESFLV